MQYIWKINTINAKRGVVRDLDPTCYNTQVLLQNGAIEAYEIPSPAAIEVAAIETAPEVKRRGRPRKVKADE